MSFVNPFFLILLLLVPLMALFTFVRSRIRAAAVRRIGDAELVQRLLAQISPQRRLIKAICWLTALCALIIALARPLWGVDLQRVEKTGIAIMVVLDVSRSMDALDSVPSRLERAKLDLRDLLPALKGNDVGVVLFAAEPILYLPLTYDLNSAELFISSITTNAITAQGTAIADALTLAQAHFAERTAAQRVMILVSDGENHEGDALGLARELGQAGIIIHTVGYGTPAGAAVPVYDELGTLITYKTDAQDQLVNSALNADLLRGIADVGNGTFALADGVNNPLIPLIGEIDALEAGLLGDEFQARPIERLSWFILFALIALTIEILLPETRRENV
jgi:Ca-activated chloride channel family protein